MAVILNRTVFVDNRNDQVRFCDWNIVNTPLGAMVEPRNLNMYPVSDDNFTDIDVDDEMHKIDKIEFIDERDLIPNLFHGLHGGNQLPQDTDYN
jgi:hypothetical protein